MLKIIDFQNETEKPRKRYRGSRGNKNSHRSFAEQYSSIYNKRHDILSGFLKNLNINSNNLVIRECVDLDDFPIEIEDVSDYPYEEGSNQLLEDRGAHPPSHIVPDDWYRTADPNEIDDIM